MFPDQVIFMPHWAYPQFTMDLPVVLPVGTQLNVIVTHQEFKKRKNIIPLIAIACAPSGIRNITDLESYVNQC